MGKTVVASCLASWLGVVSLTLLGLGCASPEPVSGGSEALISDPTTCGSRVPDASTDGEIPDCEALCPPDSGKLTAGVCGCGQTDLDSDGDGVSDCVDACPNDALKVATGLCGCGTPDTDSDGDGLPDCRNACLANGTGSDVGRCGILDASLPEAAADADVPDSSVPDVGAPNAAVPDAGLPDEVAPDLASDVGVPAAVTDAGANGGSPDVARNGGEAPEIGVPDTGVPATEAPDVGVPIITAADGGLADVELADAPVSDAILADAAVADVGLADAPSVADAIVNGGVADAAAPDARSVDAAFVDSGALDGRPSFVDITWMSISNVFYEIGPLNILTDGYITRIPLSNFFGGKGGLAFTHQANKPDSAAVSRVLDALGGSSKVNLLLTGHSHFDHTFDTATWSALTGASIIGSQTTCFQVMAQNIPTDRCRVVVGGEKITLAGGVTMRVVRWNHSGDAVSNPEQHNPIELAAVPVPDPATGGLHGGVSEDFPNGGGGRAFLFTVDGSDGPFSWFFQNSASTADLNVPIVLDGVDYGAPLANLKAAMADAGLETVDLWIGTGGATVAQLVLPIIKPKAYLPVHWDGLGGAFLSGVPNKYSDNRLATLLSTSGVKLLSPIQYMDKWRLDRNGIQSVPNTAVKTALGF